MGGAYVDYKCPGCGEIVQKQKSMLAMSAKKGHVAFCSRECSNKGNAGTRRVAPKELTIDRVVNRHGHTMPRLRCLEVDA